MSHPRYVTKFDTLFEVLERKVVRNAGLMGGNVVEYMLLNVCDPDARTFTIDEATFATYDPVATEDAELTVFEVTPPAHLIEQFHAALDRWAEEAPPWLS